MGDLSSEERRGGYNQVLLREGFQQEELQQRQLEHARQQQEMAIRINALNSSITFLENSLKNTETLNRRSFQKLCRQGKILKKQEMDLQNLLENKKDPFCKILKDLIDKIIKFFNQSFERYGY